MSLPTPADIQLQLYDHLLQFQLFQGLSRAELLQLVGNTKFDFLKLPASKNVITEGTACQQLFFLISGRLRLSTRSMDHGFAVMEQLSAPWLLQPEALFGSSTRFTCSAQTETESHFITLSKDEVTRLLNEFLIIRLNMLNLLATQSQRRLLQQWRRPPQSLRERIIRFLLDHSTYPAGHKDFLILMKRLANELGYSRLDVSKALNAMKAEGLVDLQRGRIIVPSLEHLLSAKAEGEKAKRVES